MAQATNKCDVVGACKLNIKLLKSDYTHVILYVIENICVDILLGRDFLERHERVIFYMGSKSADLIVSNRDFCAVSIAEVETTPSRGLRPF